jgi:hypothetical protein
VSCRAFLRRRFDCYLSAAYHLPSLLVRVLKGAVFSHVDRSLTDEPANLTEAVQPDSVAVGSYPIVVTRVMMDSTMAHVVILPGLVVILPGAVVMLPGLVVMLPAARVVMDPANAVEDIATVSKVAQRVDWMRFISLLLVNRAFAGVWLGLTWVPLKASLVEPDRLQITVSCSSLFQGSCHSRRAVG